MNDPNLSSFIWSVADLLRGDYKQSEYGKVILPFTVATKPMFRSAFKKRRCLIVAVICLRYAGTMLRGRGIVRFLPCKNVLQN
jgi:hypothetical protein